MRSTNPILRDSITEQTYALAERPMTVSGSMNKLLFFSVIVLIGAYLAFHLFTLQRYDILNMALQFAFFPLLIITFIIAFKPKTTPYLGTLFAFIQGFWVSAFSCVMEKLYDGIVSQAVIMTLLVVFVMAFLYKFGVIKATEKFKSIVFAATISIGLFYIISYVAGTFFHANMAFFDMSNPAYSSPLAIGVNIFIVIFASLNLIIDFDFIEKGSRAPLPALYEWYGAFGLLVTILWMYIEILRLLSRFRSR